LIGFKEFLEKINEASTVYELNQVKKIKGEKKYFRYKFGDYRWVLNWKVMRFLS
jgi:mRNA-degrading endonuclease RelE of RelBE toxin-antitoxin system